MSIQKHEFRSEFWINLNGFGILTVENMPRFMSFLKHTLINKGDWHTFYTLGDICTILEIQYGSDVRESDIERKE